jgi:two-component system, cell cycle sensor histidine kinase and response regulator CckA
MSSETISPRPEPGKYRGRVLVVDDEAPVREIAVLVLQHLGFTVDAAADAEAALALIDGEPGRYALFLIDMTMPGQDGIATLRHFRQRGAVAPAVLMSGFAEQHLRKQSSGEGIAAFLQKPFDYGTLRATIDMAFHFGA